MFGENILLASVGTRQYEHPNIGENFAVRPAGDVDTKTAFPTAFTCTEACTAVKADNARTISSKMLICCFSEISRPLAKFDSGSSSSKTTAGYGESGRQ